MSTTTLAGATPADGATRRLVDAPTRMAHALMALCVTGATLTADGEHWRALHIGFGVALAGVLAFRVVYGLVGPRQARVALGFRKLAAAPGWLRTAAAALRERRLAGVPWRQGQNLLLAGVLAALPLLMVPLLASGLLPHWGVVTGDAADAWSDLHEALGDALLVLALAHVGLIGLYSLLRRQNQARPMLDGRVAGRGPDLAPHNRVGLALGLLVAALALGGWQWQAAQAAAADKAAAPVAGPGSVAAQSPDDDDDDD